MKAKTKLINARLSINHVTWLKETSRKTGIAQVQLMTRAIQLLRNDPKMQEILKLTEDLME